MLLEVAEGCLTRQTAGRVLWAYTGILQSADSAWGQEGSAVTRGQPSSGTALGASGGRSGRREGFRSL